MAKAPRDRPHLLLSGHGSTELYTSPRRGFSGRPPLRVRANHAQELASRLSAAVAGARQQLSDRNDALADGQRGFYLEFEMPVAQRAAADALENKPAGIELVAVHPPQVGDAFVSATVFVPEAAAEFFSKKVDAYRDQNTPKGKPKNENLVARIESVRLAALRSLFTDEYALFPQLGLRVWWEVWLRDNREDSFKIVADRLNMQMKPQALRFPERAVMLALADTTTMGRLIENTDAVAELRLAKDTPAFFLSMQSTEQAEWSSELLGRLTPPSLLAPAVCLFDSGANRGHPLIAPGLDPSDQHSYDAAWGVDDSGWNGHGTAMSGIALYGDLADRLTEGGAILLRHRLETFKLLPPFGQNDPQLYGAITESGVLRVESQAPLRRRVFCMAVTSDLGRGRGRPSSWSAAVDQICYGGGDQRRLMVLSIGNLRDNIIAATYPDSNDLAEAESPAQAWNAIVVGAYTDKTNIDDVNLAGWNAVAPAGDLSPASRTSGVWDRQWPIRPDVVFEGGNLAHDGTNPAIPVDDLQLVTTYHLPNNRLFESFGDTSAAAGLAANMLAGIIAARSALWPETVRALLVHSAEWTAQMRSYFISATNQTQKMAMLRRYGWGVPDLQRAILSASNDATLMVEDEVTPYRKDRSVIKTRDMKLHRLPWPRDELRAIGDKNVELRMTLSYFIEPNPGERGWTRRHRYASHSLRFALKRSLETLTAFRKRINKSAVAEEEGDAVDAGTGSDNWVLGSIRDRGSIHSDIWRGSGSELAECDAVGVFPISGWWKEKPSLQRWERSVRYALVVSIRAPEIEVDLYTGISNQLDVMVSAT